MHTVMIVTVVFSGIVLALAIISGTILMAIKIIKGGVSRKDREKLSNEAGMVQEIYQGLGHLEERIETLETILLDREKRNRNEK
ncbi:MAG: phage-shock protein [Deltaproteobacteria bacterium]|nr:phage-shock protein [Deltaproteobacteria bacterium]